MIETVFIVRHAVRTWVRSTLRLLCTFIVHTLPVELSPTIVSLAASPARAVLLSVLHVDSKIYSRPT